MIVGLTGGIASGKSEAARELARMGALVIDADVVARDVTVPGAVAYEAIAREFGESVLDASGQIDRAALGAIAFADEGRRRLLNSITHPAIFDEIVRRVGAYAGCLDGTDVPAAVVDAALIVDVGASSVFDLLLVVTADEECRVRRLTGDRGMSERESRARISAQIPDSQRVEMGDLVIENNGTLGALRSRAKEAWREIERRSRSVYF